MPDGRANNGGARPGAGRPRAEATVLREILIKKMEEQAEPIAEALIAKALERDVPAIKEILDRGLGKSVQGVELSGKDGKDLPTPILNFVPSAILSDNGDKENPSAV